MRINITREEEKGRTMKEKIQELISQLTLEEKAALCSGVSMWDTTPIERLGIPSATMSDGPHGLRREPVAATIGNVFQKSLPATCFPPAVTLAATWNRKLAYAVGEALADECLEQGVGTILGPGINIKRSPLCGRNFEYFSEDPMLAGEMGAAYIQGVQRHGVGTSLKHFAVNSQEYRRQSSTSEVDERALREIYLAGFERTVKKAKPASVMCSYNRINGVFANDNQWLLTDVLRREWGYDGMVVSDWGAVNDRVAGIEAGMDLEMPSSNGERDKMIVTAVEEGILTEERLNDAVANVLEFAFKYSDVVKQNKGHKADYETHHKLVRKAAAEGAVLMKNEGQILPLSIDTTNFAVIGQLAKDLRAQGAGSSKVNPKNQVSFIDYLDRLKVPYDYARGYTIKGDTMSDADLKKAKEAATGKDAVVLFVGLTDAYEAEAFDRQHMDLPDTHNRLVEEILSVNENVIVVLSGGSPVALPWANKVKAILNMYLTGEAGGEATYDLLFGLANPSGKLPETYPVQLEDCIATQYFGKVVAEYRESIFVGYRFYDTAKREVAFPFGHGLSYTTFAYSDLKVEPVGNGNYRVSFTVKNTGDYDGAEVAQIYVKNPKCDVMVAEKELRWFEKIFLSKGEEKTVSLILTERDFSYYNVNSEQWRILGGDYEIMVGGSSRNIALSETVTLESNDRHAPSSEGLYTYFHLDTASEIPKQEFEKLLGRRVHVHHKPQRGQYDFSTVVGELDGTWFCRLFRYIFKTSSVKLLPKDATYSEKKANKQGALDMPIRNFYAMSMGAFPYEGTVALLAAFNGHTPWGVCKLISELIKHKASRKKKDIYKCKK